MVKEHCDICVHNSYKDMMFIPINDPIYEIGDDTKSQRSFKAHKYCLYYATHKYYNLIAFTQTWRDLMNG